ncbi:MAG TPA: histidine triad nucleotide-binding protein [Chloroflexota bacterium]|jgi:histidine triad (HIT) family protein|nr:histidine triad nucleotide-binding protein [Chloroflexota bacterium]
MTCLFCSIVAGEIPATIVFQNDELIAFRDINPQAPTHVLVIPRAHRETPGDLGADDEALMGRVVRASAEVARQEGIADSGYRLIMNAGPDANQTVPHIHVHVLGGRAMGWPPG